MEIKNGLVQWNGRNDIPCTYAEMPDGTKYYFKQDLVNGNHIVTTSLLEAVDSMTKAQNVGLIDGEGNAVLACTNSSIKTLSDDVLLVEPAQAVSENVIEANKLRLDPLSATRLVSTPAQIKEKINSKMSAEGRYVLNDQFKDGTLYDSVGSNLVNNEYYSFVAVDGDKAFLAKNYPETDVIEFSLSEKKIIENQEVVEEQPVEEVTPTEVAETVAPVEEAPVEEAQVEIPAVPVGNINEGFAVEDIDLGQGYEAPVEEVTPAEVAETVAPVEEPPVEEVTDLGEEISIPTATDNTIEANAIDSDVHPNFNDVTNSFDEITEETPTEEVAPVEEEEAVTEVEDYDKESDIEKRLNELNEKFDSMNSYMSKFEEKPEEEVETQDIDEEDNADVFTNSEIQVDSIDDIEDEDLDVIDEVEEVKDTTMEDATKAISDLVQKYTDKENELNEALEREEKLKASRKNYIERTKAQEQKISLITAKNRDLVDTNTKLEAKIESLSMSLDLQKRKGEEQKRTIGELSRENERLRSQLEGKEELARALESAKALMGYTDSYNDEDSYYSKAA